MKYYPGDILSKDWNPPVEIKGYRYFHLDTGKNNALEICWYDATFEDLYEDFGGYKRGTSDFNRISSANRYWRSRGVFNDVREYDGLEFLNTIENIVISFPDVGVTDILVDGYISNLGLIEDKLGYISDKNSFLVSSEVWKNLCNTFDIKVLVDNYKNEEDK